MTDGDANHGDATFSSCIVCTSACTRRAALLRSAAMASSTARLCSAADSCCNSWTAMELMRSAAFTFSAIPSSMLSFYGRSPIAVRYNNRKHQECATIFVPQSCRSWHTSLSVDLPLGPLGAIKKQGNSATLFSKLGKASILVLRYYTVLSTYVSSNQRLADGAPLHPSVRKG